MKDEWTEAAYLTFSETLDSGDYGTCKELISFVREHGFEKDAETMQQELYQRSIDSFHPTLL